MHVHNNVHKTRTMFKPCVKQTPRITREFRYTEWALAYNEHQLEQSIARIKNARYNEVIMLIRIYASGNITL